jgi:acetyl esterase/lipase
LIKKLFLNVFFESVYLLPVSHRRAGRQVDLHGASPIDASPQLLSKLPPLLLVVGSAEVLLGENIAFAQKVGGRWL